MCGDDGRTYFSPCFAGCVATSSLGKYSGCSCVTGAAQTASLGFCSQKCGSLAVTAVLFAFGMFFMFANGPAALSFVMRSLPPEYVSVGLSTMQALWKAVGSVPGPIVMGAIFDAQCAFKQPKCTGGSSCAIYHNYDLAVSYTVLAVTVKAASSVFYFLAYWLTRKQCAWPHGGATAAAAVVVSPDEVCMAEQQHTPALTLPAAAGHPQTFVVENPNIAAISGAARATSHIAAMQ